MFYNFYSTWSVNQWGMEANQAVEPQGFIAMGDRPNFEALRQVWRATVIAVAKFEPCLYVYSSNFKKKIFHICVCSSFWSSFVHKV